jgi:hypothetical protein
MKISENLGKIGERRGQLPFLVTFFRSRRRQAPAIEAVVKVNVLFPLLAAGVTPCLRLKKASPCVMFHAFLYATALG